MDSTRPTVAAPTNPHVERFGGEATVVRRVDAFDRAIDARDAWMGCMRQAPGGTCVDEAPSGELDRAFLKIANRLRNST